MRAAAYPGRTARPRRPPSLLWRGSGSFCSRAWATPHAWNTGGWSAPPPSSRIPPRTFSDSCTGSSTRGAASTRRSSDAASRTFPRASPRSGVHHPARFHRDQRQQQPRRPATARRRLPHYTRHGGGHVGAGVRALNEASGSSRQTRSTSGHTRRHRRGGLAPMGVVHPAARAPPAASRAALRDALLHHDGGG
jgi:hypothetical protein